MLEFIVLIPLIRMLMFSAFTISKWWNIVILTSVIFLITSLTIYTTFISNLTLFYLSMSMMFFGLGKRACTIYLVNELPSTYNKGSYYANINRFQLTPIGLFFFTMCVIFLCFMIYAINLNEILS